MSQQMSVRRRRHQWLPQSMREPPHLSPTAVPGPLRRGFVLLINPFYRKDPHSSFAKHVLTPTLALTAIAAGTPEGWETRYWDENLIQGPPPLDPLPEVVGITVHLTFAERAYELAAWFRRFGVKVVLGGLHVLTMPDEAEVHADALVIGEGVQHWGQVLEDIRENRLRRRYDGSFREAYSSDPAPRRDLLQRNSYLTTTSVIATRGCHNRCDFCYLSTAGLHMPYRLREVQQVVDEIKADGQPYAVFTDNNLGSRPQFLYELCAALEPLEIIWSAALTLDVTDDPQLVRAMALSGCTGVFIGFESLNEVNLTQAGKRSAVPDDFARRVRIFHDNGIQVNGSFVLGFDHDEPDVFERTVAWVENNRLECATFHIMTPYPGTPHFAELEGQSRIIHRHWSLYDTAHVVFKPLKMSAEQLFDGYDYCYRRLFSHVSIWRRRPRDWRAVVPYLAMSYLYKRSNLIWHLLIRTRLTARVWRPLIELSRRRHLKFRRSLRTRGSASQVRNVVSGGV